MSTTIIREVPGSETEIGMGVIASTPGHYVVAWGEYAADGEADGEIRVLSAVNEDGNDVTAEAARVVARAIGEAIEGGHL